MMLNKSVLFYVAITLLIPNFIYADTLNTKQLTPTKNINTKTANKKAETKKEIYLLKNTHCRYNKKDRKTYCLDKENKRITGEIRRYQDGKIIRSIPVTNSLVHGKVISKDIDGNLIYTKEYVKGIQEGLHETYYENNIKSSSIPYVNGQKEGVAKYYYENGYMQFQCGYVEDLMDGEARMYDNEGKVLYNIMTANDKFVSGTCNYMNEKNEVNTKDIPSLLLEAFNAKCLLLGSKIAKNHCSIDKINKTKDCNPKWLEKNKKEINSYLKTYIKDNSVEKNKNS